MLKIFMLGFVCFASANVFERLQLLHLYPQNDFHRELLEQLKDKHDVWYASYDRYDILLSSSAIQSFLQSMHDVNIPSKIVNDNVLSDAAEEAHRLANKAPGFDYDDFNNLTAIYQELDVIATKCIKGFVCEVDSVGDSVEKQPIQRLKISKSGAPRKIVWLDSTTHAREWLTPATNFKIIKNFLDNYNKDPDVTALLNKYDWYFVPVVNPDGYSYSWKSSKTRMWRKNRRINTDPKCPGVDLNRNADNAWGTVGASSYECADTYCGPSVASEPETQALQNQFKALGSKIVELISMHSYGQYWLISFGHVDSTTNRCYVAPDASETLRVANAAADAIEKFNNTKWMRGPSCSTIYAASGGMIDYAKGKAGVPYTAVPELRGSNFVVPPTEIDPSFKEIWAGIVASIKAIEKKTNMDI